MLDILAFRIEAELGDAGHEFLEENVDLRTREMGADTFVRAIAKGVVRRGVAVEIDLHRPVVHAIVDPRQIVGDHDHLVLLEQHTLIFEVARQDAPGVRQAETAEKRSEEHTSELQSLMRISYAVFCLKKKNTKK